MHEISVILCVNILSIFIEILSQRAFILYLLCNKYLAVIIHNYTI